MSEVKNQLGTDVIIGDFSKKKKPKNIKRMFIILGILCVVGVISAVAALYVMDKNKSPIAADGSDTRQKVVAEALVLARQGKGAQAKTKINEVFKKVKTNEDKEIFLGSKLAICLIIKDYDCARETNIERSKVSNDKVLQLQTEGRIYTAEGKKQDALRAYNEALVQAKKSDSPNKNAYIEDISQTIEGLQSAQ